MKKEATRNLPRLSLRNFINKQVKQEVILILLLRGGKYVSKPVSCNHYCIEEQGREAGLIPYRQFKCRRGSNLMEVYQQ